ncbi:MAG: ribonuclease HII [Nitrospirota bacterium]
MQSFTISEKRRERQQRSKRRKSSECNDLLEKERFNSLLRYERETYSLGYRLVAGIDEAGRGPLAGPVVAAAVILPEDCFIDGLRDSKRVSEKKRERLFDVIYAIAIDIGIGIVDEKTIDRINILQATIKAAEAAVKSLTYSPDFLLTDAIPLPLLNIPQKSIIKGDALSASIASASIIAKVTRDRLMMKYHRIYPEYNFHIHKGYGTREHLNAINKHGPCEIHRKSFRGVR